MAGLGFFFARFCLKQLSAQNAEQRDAAGADEQEAAWFGRQIDRLEVVFMDAILPRKIA